MGKIDLEDHKKLEILRSQIEKYKVADVMDTEYPQLSSEDTVNDVLALMKKSGFQDVPVIDKGEYIGMVSYGTLLKRKGVTADSKVKGILANNPTANMEDSLMDIAEKMVSSNCRQMAVVVGNSKKKVAGVVSRRAIVDIVAKIRTINEIKVWEVMTNPVETVFETDTLDKALEVMRELDIRTVPVVGPGDKVIGILGMQEVIDNNWKSGNRSVTEFTGQSKIEVGSICTNSVVTVNWDSDLESAAELMSQNKISTLPVLESGAAVGVITQYDIIEIVAACREREMLFVQLSGLSESDKEYTEQIYEDIQSEIAKISKVGKPSSLTIHYGKYNDAGGKQKYSVTARLCLDGDVFTAKEVDWDINKTTSNLMKKISSAVMDSKDAKDTFRKRKK